MIEWEASYKELNESRLNGDILKIAGAELTRGEAARIYENNLFIVNGRGVWQVLYSTAQRTYYGQNIIRQSGLTKRGRFHVMDAAAVNRLIGAAVVWEN